MEIRITALRLRNFKGVRTAEYLFNGRNARIEGPNGSGKSTVFDAFTWLLFGKDHRDQTTDTFELKTIDPVTGRPFPHEDHWVEAVLTVDGQSHVLRRCWVENWVKPTGQIEDVMKGHTSAFYVDGVDVGTKRAYDAVVGGWMQEGVFKLLTNPHYFIDEAFTPWRNRRKALLDLVKDAPERARVREEFADVVDRLSGRSIEEYRKKLAAEKAANRRDLADALSRIDGMREALPEEADTTAVRARLDALRTKRDEALTALKAEADDIDKEIARADQAVASRKAENDALWADITKIQTQMGRLLADARKAALDQNGQRERAILEARHAAQDARYKKDAAKVQIDQLETALNGMEALRGKMAGTLQEMGEKYRAEKARAFEYTPETRCPYCGQEIPAATVAEARAKAEEMFRAERKQVIDKLITDAKALKDHIARRDEGNAEMKSMLAKARQEYDEAQREEAMWTAKAEEAEAVPVIDLESTEEGVKEGRRYKAFAEREQELRTRANATTRSENTEELLSRRKTIEERIVYERESYSKEELEASEALSVNKVRQDQLMLIARKEVEAKSYADALARAEREEARAAEFMKADIDSVETAINSHFHTARWKMFDQTIDGGIVEMCEVASPDGVPYKSMNDAMKILCGLDCIRVFSERYGSSAPIFIDNAESITQERFDTPAQVIRLMVKDSASLTLTSE